MERKWWTLVLVCVAIFMLLLDITVVNVALPDIEHELNASFSDLQWVIDAYALTLATLVLTAGSLADLFGRKRVFVTGLALFTASSALCGSATGPLFLILARGAQGVGGAIMFATSLALLSQEFQGRERGTAFGIWGATVGAAVAIGPLVGGLLTTGAGWRWIFFVNIPIGIAGLVAGVLRLGESRDPEESRLDPLGVATFSAGVFMVVFALVRGNAEGWSSALIVALLAAGIASLALFVFVEHRQRLSMFDLSLFRKPAFTGAQIVAFTLSAGIFSMFLYLTLYLQNVLGYSALQAGLRFLPISLMSLIAAPISGKLSAYVPVRLLIGVGLGVASLGLALMHGLDTSSRWTALLPGFLLSGFGLGLVNPALASTAIGVVRSERAGMASGINTTFRQVGIATGIAGLGAVFQHHVTSAVQHAASTYGIPTAESARVAQAVAAGRAQEVLGRVPPQARQAVAHVAKSAFVGGLNELVLIGAAVTGTGAVCALALIRRRDFVAARESAPEAASA
jgi:EmrB/QacA subfamily drug resistance transporter